jgi:hypothetical protein
MQLTVIKCGTGVRQRADVARWRLPFAFNRRLRMPRTGTPAVFILLRVVMN